MMHYLLMVNNQLERVYEEKKYAHIMADAYKIQGKNVSVKSKKLNAMEVEYFKQQGKYAQLNS